MCRKVCNAKDLSNIPITLNILNGEFSRKQFEGVNKFGFWSKRKGHSMSHMRHEFDELPVINYIFRTNSVEMDSSLCKFGAAERMSKIENDADCSMRSRARFN